jgi:hypothetical protein
MVKTMFISSLSQKYFGGNSEGRPADPQGSAELILNTTDLCKFQGNTSD